MNTSISLNYGIDSKQALDTSSKDIKFLCDSMRKKSLSKRFPILSKFVDNCLTEIDMLSENISASLEETDIIFHIRHNRFCKERIRSIISNCTLLEMKNTQLKESVQHLKTELYRLNALQNQWFTLRCNKN